MIPKEFQETPFKTAFDIATQITWSQDELEVYDYVMMKEMEEVSALNTAEEKGIKKGKEIGVIEGELKAKLEIARNALKNSVDIDTIVAITGLERRIIEKLQNK